MNDFTLQPLPWDHVVAPEAELSSARPWLCIRCGARLSSAVYRSDEVPGGPYCYACWKDGLYAAQERDEARKEGM